MNWLELKTWLVAVTALEKDALHIYAGVLVQLATAVLARRGLASPWPLLVVLLAALANEAYDLLYETWPPADRTRQWLMSVHDVLNTLAIPLLLWWVARRRSPATDLSPERT